MKIRINQPVRYHHALWITYEITLFQIDKGGQERNIGGFQRNRASKRDNLAIFRNKNQLITQIIKPLGGQPGNKGAFPGAAFAREKNSTALTGKSARVYGVSITIINYTLINNFIDKGVGQLVS